MGGVPTPFRDLAIQYHWGEPEPHTSESNGGFFYIIIISESLPDSVCKDGTDAQCTYAILKQKPYNLPQIC